MIQLKFGPTRYCVEWTVSYLHGQSYYTRYEFFIKTVQTDAYQTTWIMTERVKIVAETIIIHYYNRAVFN